jgi:hypothetical protein
MTPATRWANASSTSSRRSPSSKLTCYACARWLYDPSLLDPVERSSLADCVALATLQESEISV